MSTQINNQLAQQLKGFQPTAPNMPNPLPPSGKNRHQRRVEAARMKELDRIRQEKGTVR